MKAVKYVVPGLTALAGAFFVVAFFLPSKVEVERSTLISAPAEKVFGLVDSLREWERWSPWLQIDPSLTIEYGEKGRGKGASYRWESSNEDLGTGTLTIVRSEPLANIHTVMEFEDQRIAQAGFMFTATGEQTRVKWTFAVDLGLNPISRYFGLGLESSIGNDFEAGLRNLKKVAESR